MHRLLHVLLPLLAVSLLTGGCGGAAGNGGGVDPATALPAGALAYAELVVRPEGAQAQEMTALLGKVLRTDQPGKKLVALIDSLDKQTGSRGSYKADVEPWLGRRAGVAVTDFAGPDGTWAIAVAARDADALATSLKRASQRDGDKRVRYHGFDVWVGKDHTAAAATDDVLLVASSQSSVQKAIDSRGAKSLAKDARFRQAMAPLPGDRAGAVYLDSQRVLEGVIAQSGSGGEAQLLKQFLSSGYPPVALAVLAKRDLVAVESRIDTKDLSGITKAFAGLGAVGATPLVGELPADSWVAAGMPKLGATAKQLFSTFAGALGGAVVTSQLEKQLGIDLERDVYSWIGDVAVFVRGASHDQLDGGAVIEVADAAKAHAAIPRLIGVLQQQPGAPSVKPVSVAGADLAFEISDASAGAKPVVVALGSTRAVVAYGRPAAEAALAPTAKLSGTPAWGTAVKTLDGLSPSLFVDAPKALALIAQSANGDAGFAKARPYLETIGTIAAGGRRDGDVLRSRFAVGVR